MKYSIVKSTRCSSTTTTPEKRGRGTMSSTIDEEDEEDEKDRKDEER
jgi:hypothetical protein